MMRLVAKTHIHTLALTGLMSAFVPSTVSAGSVTLTDPGTFQVLFGGSVDTTVVPELSASAIVHFLGFAPTASGGTQAMFDITLGNTTSGSLESRVSAFGFDTDTEPMSGTVTGLFTSVILNGALPNQFGPIDVCVNEDGHSCQGGGNGGVSTGESDSFLLTLFFSGSVDSLTLDNFGVRYQSINGASINGTTYSGKSGTGTGTPGSFNPDANVPEPGGLLLFGTGLLAFGATMRRRRRVGSAQPATVRPGANAPNVH